VNLSLFGRSLSVSSSVLRPIILVLIFFLILFGLGLRLGHPESGLKSALGPAKSNIAVYWQGNSVAKGDNVVVSTGKPGEDPALAVVAGTTPGFVDIQSGRELQRIESNQVHGKLLAIIPFIGYVVDLVGF
jgi:hypothetical protein